MTAGPGGWWHSPGWPGLPGAQRAVEDKGKRGLGFLPGIPNEWDEENGENLFLSLARGAQGIELCVIRGTLHTKPGDSFRIAPGPILSPSQHCSVPEPGLAQQGTQCQPFIWPHSLRTGLAWAFVGFFSFPFLVFEISTLDTEGQADPLLLYVNTSHNVQAMI